MLLTLLCVFLFPMLGIPALLPIGIILLLIFAIKRILEKKENPESMKKYHGLLITSLIFIIVPLLIFIVLMFLSAYPKQSLRMVLAIIVVDSPFYLGIIFAMSCWIIYKLIKLHRCNISSDNLVVVISVSLLVILILIAFVIRYIIIQ